METSKTRSIQSLLMQAWRERWSDVTWGIQLKTILPFGVSGDVYDLAGCILRNALVGPCPNAKFMSYLMHCLSCRVVSYGAVLTSISHYQDFDKPYCIVCLLDFIKTFQSAIGCHENEEQCIVLCKSMIYATHWLYSCILYAINKRAELNQIPENETPMEKSIMIELVKSMMEKSIAILDYFSRSTFMKSLLYVGKFEDPEMHTLMLQKHEQLENILAKTLHPNSIPNQTIEVAMIHVSSIDNLPFVEENVPFKNKKLLIINSTINIMVGLHAILYPASDLNAFVNQLLLVKELHNFTLPQLYCEVIRACFMGLADGMSSSEELKLCSFTFLKLPNLIARIHETQTEDTKDALEKSFDLLLQFVAMLDHTDARSNCDCIQSLANEFFKAKLLTEDQMKEIVNRRHIKSRKDCLRSYQYSNLTGASVIVRAERILMSILNYLDADYSKLLGNLQDMLLELLCHMVCGRNFEIILSAAAATGNFHTFLSKLVQFNECHKEITAETNKTSPSSCLLFDISFLMLVHIAQQYGISVVASNPDIRGSFFVTWACDYLAKGGKFKDPAIILSTCNPINVDLILDQFIYLKNDFKSTPMKWDEFCNDVPLAIKEILFAWNHDALPTDKVLALVDHIKSQMCCLPVCISAWLCNYINLLPHERRLKPMNMLNKFITPLLVESATSAAEGSSQTVKIKTADQNNLFYKDRSTLMINVIKKMMIELYPSPQTSSSTVQQDLTTCDSKEDIFSKLFYAAHVRGWLTFKSIHDFNSLLCTGGARLLSDMMVRQIVLLRHERSIKKGCDIALGIFYLDIEQFAISMLVHVLPIYMYSESKQRYLAEPYGTALARLAVMTTYAALQSRQSDLATGVNDGWNERSSRDVDMDDAGGYGDCSEPSKTHPSYAELLEDTPLKLQSSSEEHLMNAISNPINRAIADLMRSFLVIASDATISARSMFTIRFLEQVMFCGKDKAQLILQFMPLGLVPLLLKAFPEDINHRFILAMNSTQNSRSRKVTALSLCQLNIAQNRIYYKDQCWLGFPTE